MSLPIRQIYYTPEEYLTLERAAEYKSEYLDGQIFTMAGASREHIIITGNIYRLLGNQLLNKACEIYANEMKVGMRFSKQYFYPDVVVVCSEPRFHDKNRDVLINPMLIVEVLSPSTELFDRSRKFARYQRFDSFTDYLLVAQEEPHIEHFIRQEDNSWRLYSVSGLKSKLHIAAIDCVLKLSDVYNRIQFPEKIVSPPRRITARRRTKAAKKKQK